MEPGRSPPTSSNKDRASGDDQRGSKTPDNHHQPHGQDDGDRDAAGNGAPRVNGNTGEHGQADGIPNGDAPRPPGDVPTIEIRVQSSSSQLTHFKIKRNTKFGKLFNAYANREGKDVKTLRFHLEGERLLETDTPEGREMVDGEIIEVMMEQIGGAI